MLKTKFYTFCIKEKEHNIVEEQGYAENIINGGNSLKVAYKKYDNCWKATELTTGMCCLPIGEEGNTRAATHNSIIKLYDEIIRARDRALSTCLKKSTEQKEDNTYLEKFMGLMTEEQYKNHLDLLNKLNFKKYIVFLD